MFKNSQTAAALVRDLETAGVTLPDEVAAARDALVQHNTRTPQTVTFDDLAATFADPKSTDKQRETLAMRHVAADAQVKAHRTARERLGAELRHAVHVNALEITRALAELAADHIATLEELAALPTTDVAALVRAGHSDAAEKAAHIDTVAATLTHLYSLRTSVMPGVEFGTGRVDCSFWKEPHRARAVADSPTQAFLTGIKRGAGLWFPADPHEAQRQAEKVQARRKAEREQQQVDAAKRGVQFF